MKISNYIKSLRLEKVKTDLLSLLFLFIISTIGIIISLLLLEAIFYFSPPAKKTILITFFSLLFLVILLVGLFLLLINKEYFKNYSRWTLAKIIGENIKGNYINVDGKNIVNQLNVEDKKQSNIQTVVQK